MIELFKLTVPLGIAVTEKIVSSLSAALLQFEVQLNCKAASHASFVSAQGSQAMERQGTRPTYMTQMTLDLLNSPSRNVEKHAGAGEHGHRISRNVSAWDANGHLGGAL